MADRVVTGRGWVREAALVVPLVLVNAFAVAGQAGWALDNVTKVPLFAILFAVALESIGVYLAAEAHAALMAGDAALRLRLGSYATAGLVGWLNWLHWSPGPGGAVKGAAFAGFSMASPWLWAIRSRSMRRADLRDAGLIDPRSVRFAAARWVLYPRRTFAAFRLAVWAGETDPLAAIAAVENRARDAAPVLPAPVYRPEKIEQGGQMQPTRTVAPMPQANAPAPPQRLAAVPAEITEAEMVRTARAVAGGMSVRAVMDRWGGSKARAMRVARASKEGVA